MTTKSAILRAVREKCVDCSCYQLGEVRKCHITTCALWPYRFAKDPEPNSTRGFRESGAHADDSEEEEEAD